MKGRVSEVLVHGEDGLVLLVLIYSSSVLSSVLEVAVIVVIVLGIITH